MSKPMLIMTRQAANDGGVLVQASLEEVSDTAATPTVSQWDQYFGNRVGGEHVRYVIRNNTSLFNIGIERGGVSLPCQQGQDLEVRPGDVLVMSGAGTFQRRIQIFPGADAYSSMLHGLSVALSPDSGFTEISTDPARAEVWDLFARNAPEAWRTADDKWKAMMIDDFLEIHRSAEAQKGQAIPLEQTFEPFAKRLGLWNPPDPKLRADAEKLFAERAPEAWRTADSKWKAMILDDFLEIHRNAEKQRGATIPLEKTFEVFAKRLGFGNPAPVVAPAVRVSNRALRGEAEGILSTLDPEWKDLAPDARSVRVDGFLSFHQDQEAKAGGSLLMAVTGPKYILSKVGQDQATVVDSPWTYLFKELGMDVETLKAGGEANLSKVIYMRLNELDGEGELGQHAVLLDELKAAQLLIRDHRDIFSTPEKIEAFRRGLIQAYALEATGSGDWMRSREGRFSSVEGFMRGYLSKEIAKSGERDALIDQARQMDEAFRRRSEDRDREKLEVRK